MAFYRNINMTFWTDAKIAEEFTPADKLFYLYLMTNPHTHVCGCYEIGIKQISDEIGYDKETVSDLIVRFIEVHDVIRYLFKTKEMLILNWHKYNWSESGKVKTAIKKGISAVKCDVFKEYLTSVFNGIDTVYIEYQRSMDSVSIEYGYNVTYTFTVIDINNNKKDIEKKEIEKKEIPVDTHTDFEKAWERTVEIYPHKFSLVMARVKWQDKLKESVNPKDTAILIFNAIKLYLREYEKQRPDDDKHEYVPYLDKWFDTECEYWVHEYEKKRKRSDSG